MPRAGVHSIKVKSYRSSTWTLFKAIVVSAVTLTLLSTVADARCFNTSYYGHETGSKTASGQSLRTNGHKTKENEHVYGAAHRTLPFGTKLNLKGPSGNRATFVINDRGPFHPKRNLDIVEGAASLMGLVGPGVGTLCE